MRVGHQDTSSYHASWSSSVHQQLCGSCTRLACATASGPVHIEGKSQAAPSIGTSPQGRVEENSKDAGDTGIVGDACLASSILQSECPITHQYYIYSFSLPAYTSQGDLHSPAQLDRVSKPSPVFIPPLPSRRYSPYGEAGRSLESILYLSRCALRLELRLLLRRTRSLFGGLVSWLLPRGAEQPERPEAERGPVLLRGRVSVVHLLRIWAAPIVAARGTAAAKEQDAASAAASLGRPCVLALKESEVGLFSGAKQVLQLLKHTEVGEVGGWVCVGGGGGYQWEQLGQGEEQQQTQGAT